jgi:hypothetical protein
MIFFQDPMYSTYLEALGIKEGTIPPEYRKLLEVSYLSFLFYHFLLGRQFCNNIKV